MRPISNFIEKHYRHFNAAVLRDAARTYNHHLEQGGKMMLTLAGAMSTAELGLSLAVMIREDKVHAISCTGANLEEDLYNLVAHEHYERIPHYRELTSSDEQSFLDRKLNRVTDTCIPEEEAMRLIERHVVEEWKKADQLRERYFPHEFLYGLIRNGKFGDLYQIDPKDSWLVAAAERDLPLFVPGWEDSTLGNIYAAKCIEGEINDVHTVRSGIEVMIALSDWYTRTAKEHSIGFFQLGGGIAGDFPICVVPLIHQDLKLQCPNWSYFCQISDATTSFGGYSGAIPSEKISWGKLDVDTPTFVIESDATIVVPLIFAHVLGW